MKSKIEKVKGAVSKPLSKISRKDSSSSTGKTSPVYITNETVAEHREEILSGARKYIYPLQHSKRKVVWLSVSIFILTLVFFVVYSLFSLYRFQSTSTFTYRITQIIPFPIARVDGRFISYENYLFELRRYMHYYENKSNVNFDTAEGKEQLEELKKSALNQVIDDTYVKIIAEDNKISVSVAELEKEMDIIARQDRLGSDEQMLEDVLRDYWNWTTNDLKRSFRQQILARKVVSALDSEAHERAKLALGKVQSGMDFAAVASEYSDNEVTKVNGGEYGMLITSSTKDIPAKVTEAIFAQQPGSVSDVIDTGYTLEIVKTVSLDGDKAKASHIQINLKDIEQYIEKVRTEHPANRYVSI